MKAELVNKLLQASNIVKEAHQAGKPVFLDRKGDILDIAGDGIIRKCESVLPKWYSLEKFYSVVISDMNSESANEMMLFRRDEKAIEEAYNESKTLYLDEGDVSLEHPGIEYYDTVTRLEDETLEAFKQRVFSYIRPY